MVRVGMMVDVGGRRAVGQAGDGGVRSKMRG